MQAPDDATELKEKVATERARLSEALGLMVEGRLVQVVDDLGSLGTHRSPHGLRIELGVAVWPFPLEPAVITTLAALGYTALAGSDPAEQHFRHESGTMSLSFMESGGDRWTDYLIARAYLQHVPVAREHYQAVLQQFSAQGGPDAAQTETARLHGLQAIHSAAHAWWIDFYRFAPVEAVVQELAGLKQPWSISGGWAIDLFLGRVTRIHHDVDVVIARPDQLAFLEHLHERGWRFVTPLDGRLEPWPPHMALVMPRHQAHAHRDGAFIDFLLTDFSGDVWHYRRRPQIVRHVDQVRMRTPAGIPFLAPEIVLLFKSRRTSGPPRPQDSDDFDQVRDRLDAEQRGWLRWALLVENPQHPWIPLLS